MYYLQVISRYIYKRVFINIKAFTILWRSAHGVLKYNLKDAELIKLVKFVRSKKIKAEGFWAEEAQAGNEGIIQHKLNNGYGYCLLRTRRVLITTNTPTELHNFVLAIISLIQRWKTEQNLEAS